MVFPVRLGATRLRASKCVLLSQGYFILGKHSGAFSRRVRKGFAEFAENILTCSVVFSFEAVFWFELVTERRGAVRTSLVRVLS
jgi:hypothetical protein